MTPYTHQGACQDGDLYGNVSSGGDVACHALGLTDGHSEGGPSPSSTDQGNDMPRGRLYPPQGAVTGSLDRDRDCRARESSMLG